VRGPAGRVGIARRRYGTAQGRARQATCSLPPQRALEGDEVRRRGVTQARWLGASLVLMPRRLLSLSGCLAASLVVLSGCALIQHGRTQVVRIESSPPGARAIVQPGGQEVTTPGDVVLQRKSSYAVRVESEGYAPASVALVSTSSGDLWRNVVWVFPPACVAGVVTDVATGATYELKPDRVFVPLQPAPRTSARR
jgi:hypothetical protein